MGGSGAQSLYSHVLSAASRILTRRILFRSYA
jgi:hypothetical protein